MSDGLTFSRYAPSDNLSRRGETALASLHRFGGAPAARPPSAPPPRPSAPPLPRSTQERMQLARDRIRAAAESGQRIRSYEVALDLDLSEFHFARQFRLAFGRSPHVYYDEVRARCARELLEAGHAEGDVARRIGFRRPAELRALLSKRGDVVGEAVTEVGALAEAGGAS